MAHVSEAGALAAFNLYLGGIGARGTRQSGPETVPKSRRELVDLFLAKNPEFAEYRKSLAVGDDVILSREEFPKELKEG